MARRRDGGRRLNKLLVAVVLVLAAWTGGLFAFTDALPRAVNDADTRTDAIVVLTGGSGRLAAGLDLLSNDLAERLFVSGVYRGIDVRRLIGRNDLESRIGIGNAVDTAENATETAAWARRHGVGSLRLVTAAYHMPRSLLEFRHALPGVRLLPNPVFPKHVKQDEWWAWPGTASLLIREYNKFLLAWTRHRAMRLFAPPERASGEEKGVSGLATAAPGARNEAAR